MRGKPKFKEGDKVDFSFKGETKNGEIWVVDKWGTFDDPTDVSYDIYVGSENMLYKHFGEKHVKRQKND